MNNKQFTTEWYFSELEYFLKLCKPADDSSDTTAQMIAMFASFLCGRHDISAEDLGGHEFVVFISDNMEKIVRMIEDAVK